MLASPLLRHRRTATSLLFLVLAFSAARVLAVPVPVPPQLTMRIAGQPDVELRISGPKIIHRSDRVEFKAMLINHAPIAVLIGPAERSRGLAFVSWWDATDAAGAILGHESIGYCPVNGLDYSHKWRLTDSAIRMLKPGESAEVPLTFPDPRDPLKFRKKGTYQLTLHYFFNPPGREPDAKDGNLVLTNYETSGLNPASIKALRQARGFSIESAPFTIILE